MDHYSIFYKIFEHIIIFNIRPVIIFLKKIIIYNIIHYIYFLNNYLVYQVVPSYKFENKFSHIATCTNSWYMYVPGML